VKSIELAVIELMYPCPACGAPMPVNAFAAQCLCSTCLVESELPPAVWREAFKGVERDVVDFGFGYLRNGPLWDEHGPPPGPHAEWLRGHDGPPCPGCGERMVAALEQGVCRCRACGATRPILVRPEGVADGSHVIGYVSDEPAQPPAREPVVVVCTGCGGPLEADGSSRTVRCRFCSALVVLPEGVWAALHPPRRKQRWWVVVAVASDPRRERLTAARDAPLFGTLLLMFVLLWAPFVAAMVGGVADRPWLAGAIAAAILLLILGSWARKAVRYAWVCKPEQEVVGRLVGRWRWSSWYGGTVDIVLTPPGQPDHVLGRTTLSGVSADRFRELGSPTAAVRAWMLPGRPGTVHVEPVPSVLDEDEVERASTATTPEERSYR
jgi:hypothetical protein